MDNFSYTAITQDGKEKKGSMNAEDEASVKKALKSENLIPMKITKQSAMTKDISFGGLGKKIKPRHVGVLPAVRQHHPCRRPDWVGHGDAPDADGEQEACSRHQILQ